MFERCLYFNSNALVRRVNKKWQQAYEKTGLSPAHAYLLRLLLDKGELSQKQIAEELQLEKSTVTRFVSVLEDKGLLQREKIGREQIIRPTTAAKKMKQQLNRIGDELYQELAQTLGATELKQMVSRVKSIGQKLG